MMSKLIKNVMVITLLLAFCQHMSQKNRQKLSSIKWDRVATR